nr:SURF1 family protein [Pelomonas sp. PFR6]
MTCRRGLIVLLAALLAVALTARLGIWQLDRAAQKRALQAAIDARGAQAPLAATELDAAAEASQLHRRVRLRGHWLAERTVFLDNRPMDGRFGFYIVTPLRLEGRAEAILVQRGWLPRNAQDRSRLPALATPAGTVEIEGRLIAAPSRLYEFEASASGPIRQNLGAAAYAQETGQPLLPLTVLQTGPAGGEDGQLLRDWQPPDLGLQKHYGYAFQWFALSALFLGLYVWFQLIRPRRRAAA